MSVSLYVVPPKTTVNSNMYLNLLHEKMELYMRVHKYSIFMHDGAPCHRSKIITKYLRTQKIKLLDWPDNNPDLNPIENLWCIVKNKVAKRQPFSSTTLVEAIKHIWFPDIFKAYCKSLISSIPKSTT